MYVRASLPAERSPGHICYIRGEPCTNGGTAKKDRRAQAQMPRAWEKAWKTMARKTGHAAMLDMPGILRFAKGFHVCTIEFSSIAAEQETTFKEIIQTIRKWKKNICISPLPLP